MGKKLENGRAIADIHVQAAFVNTTYWFVR